MSDAISSSPASQRATDHGNSSDAKGDTAPLKAFESALLTVKAGSAPPTLPTAAPALPTVAGPNQGRNAQRSVPGSSAKEGGKSTAKSDGSGPRPATSSTTTAIAGGVQGGVASETTAKTAAQTSMDQSNAATKSTDDSQPTGTGRNGAPDALLASSPLSALPLTGEPATEALAPTVALSQALADGSSPDVKAALQSTLEGFADRSVPDAIKASLSKGGAPASAEITVLLDNISVLAKDILDKGPLSDVDFANLDQLFWVSNWFALFNQSAAYDPNNTISHSVSAAMAMPLDIFYTRALLIPLVDAERVASPGLASRRAVRANTEPTPGLDSPRIDPAL
jgi:hypothetical protein